MGNSPAGVYRSASFAAAFLWEAAGSEEDSGVWDVLGDDGSEQPVQAASSSASAAVDILCLFNMRFLSKRPCQAVKYGQKQIHTNYIISYHR